MQRHTPAHVALLKALLLVMAHQKQSDFNLATLCGMI